MRKLTWIDWVAGALILALPVIGWLTMRKPRERRRARRTQRAPLGPQIRR